MNLHFESKTVFQILQLILNIIVFIFNSALNQNSNGANLNEIS